MTETTQVVGRAKTALVFDGEKAVISAIVARGIKHRSRKRRLRFCGRVEFTDSVKRHVRKMILPIIDCIVDMLGLTRKDFELSAVNLGAASALDVGVTVSGLSADVPIFIAMLSEALQVSISDDFVSTGHIASVEGDIRAVKGIPAKVEAARSDSSIRYFICPDLERDESLKALCPKERDRGSDAIMAVGDSVRVRVISEIGELIRLVFAEENVIPASLREGFFGVAEIADQFDNPIRNVVSFLTCNNQRRFWDILQRHFMNTRYGKCKELLGAYAQFFIRRQEYPAGFGAGLVQLIRSLPPAVRPKRIFPILDKALCKQLYEFATERDYDDLPVLIDAAYGRNIMSKVDTRPINTQLEAKTPDRDCIVFDAVVSQIRERAVAEHVAISIDSARCSYSLESSTVETYIEFIDVIEAYYIHMQRYISSSPDTTVDVIRARTKAIELLQRTFRDKGGDRAAFATARDGIKGGLRSILDALTEQHKAEKKEAYIEMVFKDAIEALGWDEQLSCIRGLVKRAGQCLPEEFKNEPPERFAKNYNSILRTYVKSLDNVEQFLRTM